MELVLSLRVRLNSGEKANKEYFTLSNSPELARHDLMQEIFGREEFLPLFRRYSRCCVSPIDKSDEREWKEEKRESKKGKNCRTQI